MAWDHDWYNDLSTAEAAAVFPGAVMTARRFRDREPGGGTLTGSFTVPANGWRKLPVPISKAGFSITVGGVARTIVETTPSSGQVQLYRLTGAVRFHASDIGGTAAWSMTPWVSAITGEDLGVLQAELIATQTAVLGVAGVTGEHVVHVSKGGNDGTGTGSAGRPYLTIGAAVAAIGTPSATNRWVVDIGPGTYDEAVVLTKSYVTLRGAGPEATVIRHDVAASASSALYAGPLKIHSGTWNTNHSGDTALAGVVVRDLSLTNTPTVDDGDVYCALCIGDPTRALTASAIETPGCEVLVENVHATGYRDTVTVCGRADVTFRECRIRGKLDTVFPIGANCTFLGCLIENYDSVNNAVFYLCGTERVEVHHCVVLCDSSGTSGAFSVRTDTRDTSGVVLVVSNTWIGTTGAPQTLRPLVYTVNNSTTSTINVGLGCTYADTGHRSTPSGGTMTWNFVGQGLPVQVLGDRYTPGNLKVRYTDSSTSGSTGPQVIVEALESNGTRNPQILTRHAQLDGTTTSAINPTYGPAAFTTSGLVLGEWLAQTYQGSAWQTSARIQAVQSATAGSGDTPAKWVFSTCADGASTLVDHMTIGSDGTVTLHTQPLGPASGGTGLASYAVGDLLYASGATTLAKLADVATGNVLLSGGVTTAPAWGKVGLTTHVSGTLAEGNGGTNQSTYTTGDLLYASATNTLSKRGIGTTGYYLVVAGGVPTWAALDLSAPPAIGGTTPAAVTATTITASTQAGCEVYHSTTQTVTGSTDTALLFDSEDSDVGTCHSTLSNTSRLTAPTAGTYLVTATVGTNDDISGGILTAWIAKNGAILSSSPRYAQAIHDHSGSSGGGAWFNLSYVLTLAANDYLEIYVNTSLGADFGSATVSLRNRAAFKRLY